MKKALATLVGAAIIVGAAFWIVTKPQPLTDAELSGLSEGDAAIGETLFWAGGCASCHADKDAEGDDKLKLGGGHRLVTAAGTFVTPNISSDAGTGIGDWSGADFANAMLRGISPSGAHIYPAYPYTSYARMSVADIADLWAFMKTLPAVSRPNEGNELSFPFSISRGIGLWKLVYMRPEIDITPEPTEEKIARGRYLVEGPGHCGECHTPRTAAGYGGLDYSRWLSGGPAPEGDGSIPNITPSADGIGSWSESDISYYLETGLTPDYDSVGGSMVSVQQNMAKLPAADREAIAAYLKWIDPVAGDGS